METPQPNEFVADPHGQLLRFIRRHGDRHITQDAYEFYKNTDNKRLCVLRYKGKYLVAASLAGILNGKLVHSITVVHRKHRRKGLGTKVLKESLLLLAQQGIVYEGFVAEDNEASQKMCERAGIVNSGSIDRTRKSGTYKALRYVQPKT